MSDADKQPASALHRGQLFATTHWTVILEARGDSSAETEVAMEKLCRTYWYPLYSYLRHRGQNAPDAQDLTQGFFAALIEKRYLEAVDRRKGKFRSFLLTALNHYVADQQKREHRLKRGGASARVPLEMAEAEVRFQVQGSASVSPDKLFERRWAVAVLERTLQRLERDYEMAGRQRLFEHLHPLLVGERPAESYRTLGEELGMSEGAVKAAVHRLRQRYQNLLREEIAWTVASPEEVDEEIDALMEALRS